MSGDPRTRLARADRPAAVALRLHPLYRGKRETLPKRPLRGFEDFAIWCTPGVAAPCRAIQADPELVYAHTNKGNTVAIVTDGTRVLGLLLREGLIPVPPPMDGEPAR